MGRSFPVVRDSLMFIFPFFLKLLGQVSQNPMMLKICPISDNDEEVKTLD